MPDTIVMASFAGALFVAALVPGPAAAFCIAAGFDRRRGVSLGAAAGVTVGKLAHLAVAAVGAVWILRMPAVVRFALLGAAAFYMLIEGLRRWRSGGQAATPEGRHGARRHTVSRGFVISVANPQSLASSVAILPLFASKVDSALGWAALLGSGAAGVAAAYLLYEVLAGIVAGRIGDQALRRVAAATYLLAGGSIAAVAMI